MTYRDADLERLDWSGLLDLPGLALPDCPCRCHGPVRSIGGADRGGLGCYCDTSEWPCDSEGTFARPDGSVGARLSCAYADAVIDALAYEGITSDDATGCAATDRAFLARMDAAVAREREGGARCA